MMHKAWCSIFLSHPSNSRSHGLKNLWFESNLSKITWPVAAIKFLGFALFILFLPLKSHLYFHVPHTLLKPIYPTCTFTHPELPGKCWVLSPLVVDEISFCIIFFLSSTVGANIGGQASPSSLDLNIYYEIKIKTQNTYIFMIWQ